MMTFEKLDYKRIHIPRLLEELSIPSFNRTGLYVAPCPIHQKEWFISNNHPPSKGSWFIRDMRGNPKNGLHHCFGCGFGGTAVDLVMGTLDIGFPSAIEFIKDRAYGRPVTSLSIKVSYGSLIKRSFKFPPEVSFEPLSEWPTAPKKYLLDRGVTEVQVDRWMLGYASRGRLAGRIVLPVIDASGSPRSYAARTYIDSDVRYLAPRPEEAPDYDSVFGENTWPSVLDRRLLIVSEGAFDALAVERANPFFSVGALDGSNVSPQQVLKLASFPTVAILTDDDLAGNRAAEKLEGALVRHVNYIRLKLPKGEDANSTPVEELRRSLKEQLQEKAPWLEEGY